MNYLEMSVNRALAELKLLDNRIAKGIASTNFVSTKIANSDKISWEPTLVKNYEENVISNLDSINDLIKRRNHLKSAIVVSNATTNVKIKDKEYTVAEAIERKSSIIYEKNLLDKMKNDQRHAAKLIMSQNEKLESQIENMVNNLISSDSKNKELVDQANKLADEQRKSKEMKLVDPIKIDSWINKLDKEIDEFESEVDFVLSESNAKTMIQIPE